MPETRHYLLNIRNTIIFDLSQQGLIDSDIGIIMNLHGSTIGRVLADGNLPIIQIQKMAAKKKVAQTKKVAAAKKTAAKKVTATTKKVAAKTSKRSK